MAGFVAASVLLLCWVTRRIRHRGRFGRAAFAVLRAATPVVLGPADRSSPRARALGGRDERRGGRVEANLALLAYDVAQASGADLAGATRPAVPPETRAQVPARAGTIRDRDGLTRGRRPLSSCGHASSRRRTAP